jgi:hypothetical protein
MVREFMQLEKVADALIRAGSGCIAAGQSLLGLKSSCEGKPRAQILTAKLTSLFSHAALPPTSGKHENRCETTDTAD